MFGKAMGMWLSFFLVVVLSVGWAAPGDADQSGHSEQPKLPRSFAGVRLGMTRHELSSVVPEADTLYSRSSRQVGRTIVVSTKKNPYVGRVEYRFFKERLQDIVIHYKSHRIPRGYDGLLDKLKSSYGKPLAQNIVEYDPKADVFFVKKTVWKDDMTAIVLSELRRMRHGEEVYDVVITMTDLALQEAAQRQEDEVRRRQEFAVPVPLEEPAQRRRQSS